jgi:hypothetical protein
VVGINALFRVREGLLPRLLRIRGFKRPGKKAALNIPLLQAVSNDLECLQPETFRQKQKRRRRLLTAIIFRVFRRKNRRKKCSKFFRYVHAKFKIAKPYILIIVATSGLLFFGVVIGYSMALTEITEKEELLAIALKKIEEQDRPMISRYALWIIVLLAQSVALGWNITLVD